MDIKGKIKEILYELEADVCGIGNIERFDAAPNGFNPVDLYPKCKSVISFGVALPKGIYQVEPHLLYKHVHGNCFSKVDKIALEAAKAIERQCNCECVPVPCDDPSDYWDEETMTAKGLISLKHAAVACGLGSLGKSTLLLNERYGNRLELGAILTNLDLESDAYSKEICIPSCQICINNCPAKAIKEGRVEQKLCRMKTFGKTERGFSTVECNRCRRLCPMGVGKE